MTAKKTAKPDSAAPFKMRPFAGVMIDDESLSLEPTAPILTLGICRFSATEILDSTEIVIDLKEQERLGRRPSISTALWWMAEDQAAARKALLGANIRPTQSISATLTLLAHWVRPLPGQEKTPEIWCCGPDHDFTQLKSLFAGIGAELPWPFFMQRDFRTIRELCPNAAAGRSQHHAAEADARHQAAHLIELNQKLGLI